jgi:hypothetical protein
MPRNSRDRAFARLWARWLDHSLRCPNSTPQLAKWLAKENLEAVATLDLYQEYDEGLAERDRRQRLILAWMRNTCAPKRRSADVWTTLPAMVVR